MKPITGNSGGTTRTRFSGAPDAGESEAAKRRRSRRWVREHDAAIRNIGSGWGVDEYGQPFLINMAANGKMRKVKKNPTGVKKARSPKPALVGADHAVSGEA